MEEIMAPFEKIAKFYDAVYARKNYAATAKYISRHSKLVTASPMSRIVDIGSGTGRLASELLKLGHAVVGIEPCMAMGDCGIKKNVVYYPFMIQSLPEYMNKFLGLFHVAVANFDVLDYIVEPVDFIKAMKNINKLLQNDGLLYVEAWNKNSMPREFDRRRSVIFNLNGHPWQRETYTMYDKSSGVYTVKFTFSQYPGLFDIEDVHLLKPRFGNDNDDMMRQFGFLLIEQKTDKFSVKNWFRKVSKPNPEL
jgi:SAM-dependent methyltransferase